MDKKCSHWTERTRCTKEEKLSCLPLIEKIVGFAELASLEGLLAWEKHSKTCESALMRVGMELAVDGIDKMTIKYCLEDMIAGSYTTGVELLKQYIIGNGILCALNGDHPNVIRKLLTANLGEDVYGEVMKQEWEKQDAEDSPTDNRFEWDEEFTFDESWIEEQRKAFNSNAEFEDIAKLDSMSIQRIWRDANIADIAVALKICSDEIKSAIFANMSGRLVAMIEADMKIMGPVRARDVEEAQERIVNCVRKLKEQGKIVVDRRED